MKLTKSKVEKLHHFAKHCIKELGIKGHIKIHLSKHPTGMPTAGYYNPEDDTIYVAVNNRAMADIMRTMAHELTHCKQKQDGIIFPEDDEGLQPIEDEANVLAARYVRFYGRKNRDIYSDLIAEGLQKVLFLK